MSITEQILQTIEMVVPKLTSGASILGSSMIISQVTRNKENRKNTTQRIICFASIFDLLVSIVWFLTNFMMPKSASNIGIPSFYFGNMTSCKVQGFVIQLSIAGIMCNSVFLSFHNLLCIKYNLHDIEIRKIEPFFYITSLTLGLSTAIVSVSNDMIHPASWNCWINNTRENGEMPENLKYQLILFYGFIWTFIIISAVNSLLLYMHVVKIEKKSSKWKSKASCDIYSRGVLIQSSMYVGGFLINWIFPSMYRLVNLINGEDAPPKWLALLAGIFVPIQGFFNALVFFRLRALRCRSESGKKWITIICIIVKSTLFCSNTYLDDKKDVIVEPTTFRKYALQDPDSSEKKEEDGENA